MSRIVVYNGTHIRVVPIIPRQSNNLWRGLFHFPMSEEVVVEGETREQTIEAARTIIDNYFGVSRDIKVSPYKGLRDWLTI